MRERGSQRQTETDTERARETETDRHTGRERGEKEDVSLVEFMYLVITRMPGNLS